MPKKGGASSGGGGKASKGKAAAASSSGSGGGAGGGGDKAKAASQVRCRHILCEKQSKINDARARLDAGEDFATVAREMSEDKARHGGDLGWFTRGKMVAEFEKTAFALKKGEVSVTIKTAHGYHIIKCEDRK